MKTLRSLVSALGAAGLLAISGAANATPVSFSITGVAFLAGSGYGQDIGGQNPENGGELLDVRFSTAGFVAQNFVLSVANPFTTFNFGTVALFEDNAHGGIVAGETDNLNVTAMFTFVSPVGTPQTLFATGIATTGSVSDGNVDYTIDWAPILVPFGTGGLFQIEVNDLGFTNNGGAEALGQFQTQTATIRLLGEPITPTAIPEPSTVALLGLGLLGVACTRRKAAADPA